jgi:hypothetical protein
MNARAIESAIAAALADPSRIAAWRLGATECPAELGGIDLEKLRWFTGLGFKVRHNGLRHYLPHSFRLLRTIGIELDLFAAYAETCAREGRALRGTDRERMHDLVSFVAVYLTVGNVAGELLWDIIRHECALAELALATPLDSAVRPSRLTASTCVAINGQIIRHDYQRDPRAIGAVAQSSEALRALPVTPCSLAYWRRARSERVSWIVLDAFSAAILDALHGPMTLDALSWRMTGRSADPSFVVMTQQLVSRGIIGEADLTGL